MPLRRWLTSPPANRKSKTPTRSRPPRWLRLEQLEDRVTPSVSLVRDINTDESSVGGLNGKVVGNLFYYANLDPVAGRELWKTDGTPAGTTRVTDINPGVLSSNPQVLAALGSTVFFAAFNPTTGRELWKSDGTPAGTALVKDLTPGADSTFFLGNFTAVGGTLFFSANADGAGTELWKTDGTAAGTALVKDIRPGNSPYGYPYSSYPGDLTAAGGVLFFSADDGEHGRELWKSDGTAAGTVLVKDIRPGIGWSAPQNLTNVNGTLFFTAENPDYTRGLWKSDGTEAGTVLVKNFERGVRGAGPGQPHRGRQHPVLYRVR
jgi:ELWxxDGT repeat protein